MDRVIITLSKIASCASARKFDGLSGLFKSAIDQNIPAAKIYELLLQLYLFNGFPCAIESLKLFKKHFPHFAPVNEQYNVNLFEKRGIINCEMVYSRNFDKLQQNIINLSPDLADWMIIEGYGKVMGRPSLSMPERELLNVAMLCTNFAEHQLFSHIKGAFNTGSDFNLIKHVIESTSEFNTEENIAKSLEIMESVSSSV